jgi:hypothetical protein
MPPSASGTASDKPFALLKRMGRNWRYTAWAEAL